MSKNRPSTGTVLEKSFFKRPTLAVACDLLGKFLVRRRNGRNVACMITETEAYDGPEDQACHARRGKTPRNAVMFGPAGHWYVYFVYGMYWMLNVVTGDEGYPAAVLIRGVAKWGGPGKLTKALAIDGRFTGKFTGGKSGLWIEDRGVKIPRTKIKKGPRIGVDYAGKWAEKPYRFSLVP
ncbi:MAG: DNA-3-methyladenine glycosylase [Candidatus Peribacteraceae bacterium]